jgi:hypothetical protein
MAFKIVGDLSDIETIAVGNSIREIARLRKFYGKARWRKLKGKAVIQFTNGILVNAELHWYEAHGIGKREVKIKRILRSKP